MTKLQKSPSNGWDAAVRLLERWLDKNERADALLESLKTTLPTDERARCQYLLYGTLRHFSLLDGLINAHVTRPPRALLRALLLVASYELLQGRAKAVALVVDHAVERGKALVSVSEVRLINAVMRKLAIDVVAKVERAAGLAEATEDASQLAEIFSHPQWLVDRWLRQFGLESTRKLLAWNQEPGLVHARWRATGETPPEFLKPTKWAGFYEVPSGHWAEIGVLLEAGKLYLQDPATRLAPLALGVRKGETVLDCCAAPGG
ncbi:MAG TPA: transcription antitermination factor NusB, partial [Opitutaceae bacterium]|nr:transcription antitermination factor NusB [Opitutaceae bacterium]